MGEKTGQKLISIIVAAYNIEEYLPRCIESLLSQTYTNLEILIVDDGSTDGTGEICDSYAKRDSRIEVIHQKNSGLSGARNTALALAKGAYIGYVDGDDWVEPEMYREMYQVCEEQGAQMAVCAYRQVGEGIEIAEFSGKYHVLSGEEALDIYIDDDREYHIYNSVWSKLFRRELVEGILFPLGKKSEDIMYTTKALIRCKTCVFLDRPFYNYVVDRAGSIMNQSLHQRRFEDEIPFWKEQIAYIKDAGCHEQAKRAAYQFYRRMLFYYIDFCDRGMKESCKKLVKLMRGEKETIYAIYQKEFIKTGDSIRMKLFLISPSCYYYVTKIYEKTILKIRS